MCIRDSVTGMLNLTVPTGSFIFDVGPNLAQYYEAICNTDKVATPCMQIKSNSNAEMPSNCQASIAVSYTHLDVYKRQILFILK